MKKLMGLQSRVKCSLCHCKKNQKIFRFLVVLGVMIFVNIGISAQTWVGTSGGHWGNPANWSPATVPNNNFSDIFIPSGVTINVDANYLCGNVTFTGTNSNLTIINVNADCSLNVTNSITVNSTNFSNNVEINGIGIVICNDLNVGTRITPTTVGTFVSSFKLNINTFQINANINLTASRGNTNTQLNNPAFTQNSGTVIVDGSVITSGVNTANIMTFGLGGGNPTLEFKNSNPFNISSIGASDIVLNSKGATVKYNGDTDQWIRALEYSNLEIRGSGIKTLQGNTSILGNLRMNGALLSLGESSSLTVYGNINDISPFGNENMIITSGTGSLIKVSNLTTSFPIGTYSDLNGYEYSPVKITQISENGGVLSLKAVKGTAPTGNTNRDLQRHWITSFSGMPAPSANIEFTYLPDDLPSKNSDYDPMFYTTTGWSPIQGGEFLPELNKFTGAGVNVLNGVLSLRAPAGATFYTYKSGDWEDPSTWTTDPSGTISTQGEQPGSGHHVVILEGRTVTVNNNDTKINIESINISAGATLDLQGTTGHSFGTVTGSGLLRLKNISNFPSGNFSEFTSITGGTVEFYDIPTGQVFSTPATFNHLNIKKTPSGVGDVTFILNANLNILGNLTLINNSGSGLLKFQIGATGTTQRTITIGGNLNVNSGCEMNVVTSGNIIHYLYLTGDLTNNGSVNFTTQQTYNPAGAPATTGAVDLIFNTPNHSNIQCNGTSNFYRIIINKGSDDYYILGIEASNVSFFKLFGPRNGGWTTTNSGTITTSMREYALGLQKGTVRIGKYIDIQLCTNQYITTEGTMLWVDGGNVSTVGNNFAVGGALRITDGTTNFFGTGGVQGFRPGGTILVEGGTLNANVIRLSTTAGSEYSTYNQLGGTVNLSGTFADNGYYRLSWYREESNFYMSGGIINVYSLSANRPGIDIRSSLENTSITGGEINAIINDLVTGTPTFLINNRAGFYNIVLTKTSISNRVFILENSINPAATNIGIQPFNVKNNFIIGGEGNAVTFIANSQNITIGGNFVINANATYVTGSLTAAGNNNTIFSGSEQQELDLKGTISANTAGTTIGFYNMILSNNSNLTLTGKPITVRGNLEIGKGTILNDSNIEISVSGNITNNGTHISLSENAGGIKLIGTIAQSISGDGTGVFGNLEINKTGTNVTLLANTKIEGALKLVSRLIIGEFELFLGPNVNIFSNTEGTEKNFTSSNMIVIGGQQSNKGIKRQFNSTAEFLFPYGVQDGANYYYLPGTVRFRYTPTANTSGQVWGTVTSFPVRNYHYLVQDILTPPTNALHIYWKTTSSDFGNLTYNNVDMTYVFTNNFVPGGNSLNYIPAYYNESNFLWTKIPSTTQVSNNKVLFTGRSGANGEYTAGLSDAFPDITILYSCNPLKQGEQIWNWNEATSWSTESHDGANPTFSTPVTNPTAVVRINDGHTITITENNARCGALSLLEGGTLDLRNTLGHRFSTLPEQPSVTGNGKLKLSSNNFPENDFEHFLGPNGGTVEYYGNQITSLPLNKNHYCNLILSTTSIVELQFPLLTVWKNLTVNGNVLLLVVENNLFEYYVGENLTINPGGLIEFKYLNNIPGNWTYNRVTVEGDVIINGDGYQNSNNTNNGRFVTSQTQGGGSRNLHEVHIGGSLENNGLVEFRRANQQNNPVTVRFFGEKDAEIRGISSVSTFYDLIVDKGTDTKPVLLLKKVIDTVSENPRIELRNGTFRVANPNLVFNMTTTDSYTLPATACLSVVKGICRIAGNANSAVYLTLNGKLEVLKDPEEDLPGQMHIGNITANVNNSIICAATGNPEIYIDGGKLTVNGQIRRQQSTTTSLKYTQIGGEVVIRGRGRSNTFGLFEVANPGSEFNMSKDALIHFLQPSAIASGTNVDVYILPETNNVIGGTLRFGNTTTAGGFNFLVESSSPLWNVEIMNSSNATATANNVSVTLYVLPLTIKNELTIRNNSWFNANGLDVTIGIGLYNYNTNAQSGIAVGGFRPGTNTQNTVFTGNTDSFVQGSSNNFTNFANLKINNTNLQLIEGITELQINNNLTISSGGFLYDNGNTITVLRDISNSGNHISLNPNGGLKLYNTLQKQYLLGNDTGEYGNIVINNTPNVEIKNNVVFNGKLTFSSGNIYLNDYFLTFGKDATVTGYDSNKMIILNGVISDIGVCKIFNPGQQNFTFPIGSAYKYTPATYTIPDNNTGGEITVKLVNSVHQTLLSNGKEKLEYYWDVNSNGFTDVSEITHCYGYDLQTITHNDWIAARYNYEYEEEDWGWKPIPDVTFTENSFEFDCKIKGDYTIGEVENFMTTDILYSRDNTNWHEFQTWSFLDDGSPTPFGEEIIPNGHPVVIRSGDEVTIDEHSALTYSIKVNGTLIVKGKTMYHSLGIVSGSGTIILENTDDNQFVFPGGNFDKFFEDPNSKVIFTGEKNSSLPVRPGIIQKPFSNVVISGSGEKFIGVNDLKVRGSLTIEDGSILGDELYNSSIYIGGNWINDGTFISGKGTVIFDGEKDQEIKLSIDDIDEYKKFNNLEINKPSGKLTINGTSVEITNELILTEGIIYSSPGSEVYISNKSQNAVVGGSSQSFIDGPIVKTINDNGLFTFPTGNYPDPADDNTKRYGPITLTAASAGDWTACYWNEDWMLENADSEDPDKKYYDLPLFSISNNEYWKVKSDQNGTANIRLHWDENSYPILIDPLPSDTRGLKMLKVVKYNDPKWDKIEGTVNTLAQTVTTDEVQFREEYDTFTFGRWGVSALFNDKDAMERICRDKEIKLEFPITLTGTPPWIVNYQINKIEEPDNEIKVFGDTKTIPTSDYTLSFIAGDFEEHGNYKFIISSVRDSEGFREDVNDGGRPDPIGIELEILETFQPKIIGDSMVGIEEEREFKTKYNESGTIPTSNTYEWMWGGNFGGDFDDEEGTNIPTSPDEPEFNVVYITFTGTESEYILKVTETTHSTECTASDYLTIRISDEPVPNIVASHEENNVCIGSIETYFTTNVSKNSYEWKVDGGVFIGSNETAVVNVQWTTEGIKSIEVKETRDSREGYSKMEVVVHPGISNIVSDDIIPESDVCIKEPFNVTIANSIYGVNYRIEGSNVMIQGTGETDNITLHIDDINLDEGKEYNMELIAYNLGCMLPIPIKINVKDTPNLWRGRDNSDWNHDENWCGCKVPNEIDAKDITISKKALNPLIISGEKNFTTITVEENTTGYGGLILNPGAQIDITGNLSIEPGGEFILQNSIESPVSLITNGGVFGEATVKMGIPTAGENERWFYLGSVIKGAKFGHLGSGDINGVYVYRRNQWYSMSTPNINTSLDPMEGVSAKYADGVYLNDIYPLNYTGQLNNGTVSRTFQYVVPIPNYTSQ